MSISNSELFLLHEAISRDTINPDMLKTLYEMKKEKIKEIHPYAITLLKGRDSRYQTYISDPLTGKRKRLTAETETVLYTKLYEHYFPPKQDTLETLFPEWIQKRRAENVSGQTIHRNINHWDKYYKDNPIAKVPIARITAIQIEDFFHSVIRQHSLTLKELCNMKFIFQKLMKLATRNKIIAYNPFNDVEINTTGCRPPNNPSDSSRVYMPAEKEMFFEELNNFICENPESTDSYAIFLLFKLGLRIGELCALKWCDIDYSENEIHIHRMETSDDNNSERALKTTIVEYTKKKSRFGDRFLPLSEYELQILNKVQAINEEYNYKDNDFIFCDSEGRTKIREIDNRIRALCDKAGIPQKSAHDIRRTVASEMSSAGVDVEIIRDFLGHSDIRTTWGYILNNKGKAQTHRIITSSLSGLNGLAAF